MTRFHPHAWLIAALFALLLGLFVSVSFALSPPLSRIEQRLEGALPGAELRLDSRIRVGSAKLGVARAALRLAGDPESRGALKGVRRVEIADYLVHSMPPVDEVDLLDPVVGDGWIRMIQIREDESLLWVYTHEARSGLDGLLVVELEDGWLSIVSVEGRISSWLEQLAEDDPTGVRDLF